MEKYLTLSEETKKELEEDFKKEDGSYPIQKSSAGKMIDIDDHECITISDFCPTCLCNLFHITDMVSILVGLEKEILINHWSQDGRESACQLTVIEGKEKHYIEVCASGLGTGDNISFSKDFPDKLKFDICREMAIRTNRSLEKYYKDSCDMADSSSEGERAKKKIIIHKALFELLYHNVRCYEDLKIVANIYHLTDAKEFYDKHREEYKESADKTNKEWAEIIKTGLYKEFKKAERKVKIL